jgi:hypothetical protein
MRICRPFFAALARSRGHEADTIVEQGLRGVSDEVVFQHCRDDEPVLITLDLDFSNPVRFSRERDLGPHHSSPLPHSDRDDSASLHRGSHTPRSGRHSREDLRHRTGSRSDPRRLRLDRGVGVLARRKRPTIGEVDRGCANQHRRSHRPATARSTSPESRTSSEPASTSSSAPTSLPNRRFSSTGKTAAPPSRVANAGPSASSGSWQRALVRTRQPLLRRPGQDCHGRR